jgi:hypothetical protein
MQSVSDIAIAVFGAASQPIGDKSPRHKKLSSHKNHQATHQTCVTKKSGQPWLSANMRT